jgi:hypothetical protein
MNPLSQKLCESRRPPIPLVFVRLLLIFSFGAASLFFNLVSPIRAQSSGLTYYVDATGGSDSNTGLAPATPWKTINKVNRSIFQPGDSILLKRGEIWREQLTVSSSGSSGHVITYAAFGTGANPRLTGCDIFSPWTYEAPSYFVSKPAPPYFVLQDGALLTKVASKSSLAPGTFWYDTANKKLYIRALSDANPADHLIEASVRPSTSTGLADFNGKSYVTINSIDIIYSERMGINNYAGTSNQTNQWVKNSTSSYTAKGGIVFASDNKPFSYSLIDSCTVHHVNLDGTAAYEGITIMYGTNFEIKNCTVHDHIHEGIDVHSGNPSGVSSIGTIHGNLVYRYTGIDPRPGIYVDGGESIDIYGNVVYGQKSASLPYAQGIFLNTELPGNANSNIRVFYNILYDNNEGIALHSQNGSDLTSISIFNNVFAKNTGHGLYWDSTVLNHLKGTQQLKNNIFWGNTGTQIADLTTGAYAIAQTIIDYNLFAALASSDTFGLHPVKTSDAKFTDYAQNDYTLQSTSPARNAGVNVGLTTDFAGNPVPAWLGKNPDIGAFETIQTIAPTVTTSTISGITIASAVTGGNVTSAGGATVTARGVCWGTSVNPAVSGSHTLDGTGTGAFTSAISGLSQGTTYHVRAYAVNSAGTAYGTDVTFATSSSTVTLPTLTTSAVLGITATGAVAGGNVTSAGGGTITARGVCWGASANPTVSGSHTSDGAGTGAFTSTLSGLSQGVKYHARAYATNAAGTAYGSDVAFLTQGRGKRNTDFNGDGLMDILWRNSVTGENLVWLQGSDGAVFSALQAPDMSPANALADIRQALSVDPAAEIGLFAGVAPKVFWSPAEAGPGLPEKSGGALFGGVRPKDATWTASLGWTDSVLALTPTYVWLPNVADTSWQIAGAADFNRDGLTDILWRNSRTGENYVWLMNGMTKTSGIYLPTVADASFQIFGTGDFNGDGETDLLWRNAATGENILWYMSGTTLLSYVRLTTVADGNWQIGGTGDFDKDGDLDILWRNYATGENYIWYMSGTTRVGGAYLQAVTDANWQIAGTGDANGDGTVDILWRNYATGENIVWYMNGATMLSYARITSVADLSWKIVGR